MGKNIDLIHITGAPKTVACPRCGATVELCTDDLDADVADDIDGHPVFEDAVLCDCGCEIEVQFKLQCTFTVKETTGRFA